MLNACFARGLVAVLALTTPAAISAAPRTPLGEKLDAHMSRLEAYGFSGSLLVAKGGEVILNEGYGFADAQRKVPFTADTAFDIGSITKQFTAAAILKLEMQGKLSVSDPISKWLEGVPDDKKGITLHHLLTHSAGLKNVFGGDYEEMPRDRLVKAALDSKLLWAPGTRYQYSNAGYSLLATVVELASGKPYEEYLRENLWKSAGMARTGYRLQEKGPLAHGIYREGEDWGTPLDKAWAPDGPWWNLRGNGGVLSTTGDLYKWHQALEGEAILSKEAKAKMFTPHVPEDEERSRKGEYGPLSEVFGAPLAEVTEMTQQTFSNLEGQHGAFQGFELLGTTSAGGGSISWVEARFERGKALFELRWNGPHVGNVQVRNKPPGGALYLPESESSFVAYDPRSGEVARLGFADGAMVLRTAGGEVRAKKEPPRPE